MNPIKPQIEKLLQDAFASDPGGPLMHALTRALDLIEQLQEPQTLCEAHPDDLAVDRFADAMKAKLAASREKGRRGWNDRAQCSGEFLAGLLVDHLKKGNEGTFEDVANFAMMLHQRGENPEVLARMVSDNTQQVQELEHGYEQLNLWLSGILAEHESTGGVSKTINEVRQYYSMAPVTAPNFGAQES